MQVAFHLRRHLPAAPATALLLLGHWPTALVRLLAQVGTDPVPPVFLVADGFLLKLSSGDPRLRFGLTRPSLALRAHKTLACASGSGGVLRLRALADNLFLPVDADLLPALLPEEADDLVRRRGLIFLPGGRILEFDPKHPVVLASVLKIETLQRDLWQPLAEPRQLAERLTEISLELPEISPDDLLALGGEGIGIEEPRPQDSSFPAKVLGGVTFGAGKTLAWLGSILNLKGLAAAGMKMMAAGLHLAPRLSESVLGRQEASLRDLLRAFQRGDVEQALRRALPLGGDQARGATAGTGARLPFHNLLYSLGNILGGFGGSGGIWITEPDLYRELDNEYRKQAQLATQRGDYRRAAFIYGKLLRDYRAAAAVLSRGGLHRDAAALYLKPLIDLPAAAREFEAAGEIDRALRMYRQLGDHLSAGDLLRRAGEEEQALAEYRLAADKLANFGLGYYQAGDLMRERAGRADLALPYYLTGWTHRPSGSPLLCALRLAQAYTHDGGVEKLRGLAKEVGEYLEPAGNDKPAAEFYNELARLADQFPQLDVRDEFRDVALLGITGKLRQRAEAGSATVELTSTLLGEGQAWAPAVVSDAQFALRASRKRRAAAKTLLLPPNRTTIPARVALVTAVCQASTSGDIFLGFQSGEVFCYRPLFGEIVRVVDDHQPILSLACTADGQAVVVLSDRGAEGAKLTTLILSGSFRVHTTQFVESKEGTWLCPELLGEAIDFIAGLATVVQGVAWMTYLQGKSLLPVDQGPLDTRTGLLLPPTPTTPTIPALLAFCPDGIVYCQEPRRGPTVLQVAGYGWTPVVPEQGSLYQPVLSWGMRGPGYSEVAGILPHGVLGTINVEFSDGKLNSVTSYFHPGPPAFRAAAVVRPGLIAGVTKQAVLWLRPEAKGFHILAKTEMAFSWPVACFYYARSKEVIVVGAEGTLVRVPEASV